MTAEHQAPQPSELQKYILANTSADSPHPPHLQHLALQIKHNLQSQHRWKDLQIHHYRIQHGVQTTGPAVGKRKRTPLPRPLISGLPPQRLYVHPDEQIAMLQAARKQKPVAGDAALEANAQEITSDQAQVSAADLAALTKVEPEREWVLPTHLKETWSLRRFGDVFDGIGLVPPDVHGDHEDDLGEAASAVEGHGNEGVWAATSATVTAKLDPWREKKRLVLATLDDDSTVVYYIVHDGIVKPRQN